jgi:hypothetical protein
MKTNYTSIYIREECFPNTLPEKCGTALCLSTNLNIFCKGIFLKTGDCEREYAVLCSSKCGTIKQGYRSTHFYLSTKWRCSVSCSGYITLWKEPITHWTQGSTGQRTSLDTVAPRKLSGPARNQTVISQLSSHSLIIILSKLSWQTQTYS